MKSDKTNAQQLIARVKAAVASAALVGTLGGWLLFGAQSQTVTTVAVTSIDPVGMVDTTLVLPTQNVSTTINGTISANTGTTTAASQSTTASNTGVTAASSANTTSASSQNTTANAVTSASTTQNTTTTTSIRQRVPVTTTRSSK